MADMVGTAREVQDFKIIHRAVRSHKCNHCSSPLVEEEYEEKGCSSWLSKHNQGSLESCGCDFINVVEHLIPIQRDRVACPEVMVQQRTVAATSDQLAVAGVVLSCKKNRYALWIDLNWVSHHYSK